MLLSYLAKSEWPVTIPRLELTAVVVAVRVDKDASIRAPASTKEDLLLD